MSFRHVDRAADPCGDGPYCWGDRVEVEPGDGSCAWVGTIEIAPSHPNETGRHNWGPIVDGARLYWIRGVGEPLDSAEWVRLSQIVGIV